jgi:hypothetical protein
MNHTVKIFLLTIGSILLFVVVVGLVAKCSREEPVTKHTENREYIMKSDSLLSSIDTHYRSRMDSLKTAYRDTLLDLKERYKVLAQKDAKVESRYRQAPSVVTCDSVITSKNLRIGTLETITAKQDKVLQVNDSLIASYAGSIRSKDQTIGQLNQGYQQATKDLEKALKPKRFGLGVMAGYGIGHKEGPQPMVSIGLSYNLIRF